MSDKEQAQLAQALMSMALGLWMLWLAVPPHRRQLARMRLLNSLQRWTGWAARRAGAASMRAELLTEQQNYALPYALSLLRDRLTCAYDRTRGVIP